MSGRRTPPAPLRVATSPTSTRNGSFGSDFSKDTPRSMSSDWSEFSFTETSSKRRSGSSSSAKSLASKKHNVNVYTTCGRHTDQFLFAGWPFSGKKQ